MSTKDKLLKRFINQPKDFTWDELVKLFGMFGFIVDNKGNTSGSRTAFVKGNDEIEVHKPHPSKIVKGYAMKNVLKFLTDKEFIKKE